MCRDADVSSFDDTEKSITSKYQIAIMYADTVQLPVTLNRSTAKNVPFPRKGGRFTDIVAEVGLRFPAFQYASVHVEQVGGYSREVEPPSTRHGLLFDDDSDDDLGTPWPYTADTVVDSEFVKAVLQGRIRIHVTMSPSGPGFANPYFGLKSSADIKVKVITNDSDLHGRTVPEVEPLSVPVPVVLNDTFGDVANAIGDKYFQYASMSIYVVHGDTSTEVHKEEDKTEEEYEGQFDRMLFTSTPIGMETLGRFRDGYATLEVYLYRTEREGMLYNHAHGFALSAGVEVGVGAGAGAGGGAGALGGRGGRGRFLYRR